MFYKILVKDHLDTHWIAWFEGLDLASAENGDTLISGWMPDQAALHGVFAKIRDLNLTLLSVSTLPIPPGREDPGKDRGDMK